MQRLVYRFGFGLRSFAVAALGLPACSANSGDALPQQNDVVAVSREALAPVAGTWTPVPANTVTNSNSLSAAAVLTDGSVLVQSAADWHVWSRLTPDSTGSYVNGTWSAVPPSAFGRLYYPFAVLKDGRFFVAGGEYLSDGETNHATAEIYDPVSNTWTRLPDSPLGDIGDVPYQVLTDGRIIMGYRFGSSVEIFDPASGTWSAGPNIGTSSGTEQTWSLLPAGTVLNWTVPQPQLYLPSTNQWVNAAVPPVVMQNTNDAEIGPGVFMPNGKLLAMSAFGNAVLYTPGTTASAPGSWVLGPSVPPPAQANDNPNGSQYTEDVPACLEPNGKVMLVSSDTIFGAGNFSEYDPSTNAITAIPRPPIPTEQPSYYHQLLILPTGQLLLTGTGSANDYIYTPVGSPSDAWRPVVQSVSPNSDGSYTVTGTQLNGLSQGASYGDEGDAHTNFPLVRLTSGSTVRYARSYGFSTMGFATGTATLSARFKLPAGIPAGSYQLAVVANGIASQSVAFTVGSSNQAPTVALTSPANNAVFTAPAQVTLNATASDADGTVSKVEFYSGTTLLGTDTTAPYSFTWANVAAGSYALTAKAYDNANATTTSTAVNIVVNSTTGTNPCAGLCTSPVVFTGPNYQSGNLGTGAVCRETTSTLHGGNCSNSSTRTVKVNGTTVNCGGWALPAARNGGYCIQVAAGTPSYASFATW